MNVNDPDKMLQPAVAAIGTFDGVHRGHRAVLQKLIEYSKDNDLKPVAITFTQHPLCLIDPNRIPATLTPLKKKKNLISETGVTPVVLDFDDKLRNTTAREWLHRLSTEFNVKALVVGYDTTFGSDGINFSLEDYKKLGEEEGIKVITVDEIKDVSSSRIRKSVAAGDMPKAQEMLGRPYSITAKVVKGNSLGHTIGYPTANIDFPQEVALPKPGVYEAIVKILPEGTKHKAMVNVGQRPTVMRGDGTVIEAHILNWNGDLYGKEITVRFLRRLRDEQKFESIEALKQQLSKDREEVLKIT